MGLSPTQALALAAKHGLFSHDSGAQAKFQRAVKLAPARNRPARRQAMPRNRQEFLEGLSRTRKFKQEPCVHLHLDQPNHRHTCQCGVVYRLAPNPDGTWTYTVLHRFKGYDGAFPAANLVLDEKGNLYGTTRYGGSGGGGVVFKITP